MRTAVIFDLEKAPGQHHPEDPDGDVLACHWLTLAEIAECKPALRSPLVWQCIQDYLGALACRCRRSRPLFENLSTILLRGSDQGSCAARLFVIRKAHVYLHTPVPALLFTELPTSRDSS